ncbi:MAG: proton-conducting transporter membrane subunit, partial [Chthoniobacterales bacterium]
MIAAPTLEIAVLVLGMSILIVEAFTTKIDRRVFAFVGMAGLVLVLVGTFFLAPDSSSTNRLTGFWSFYTADPLSIFFKRFALVTTILVLVMMVDYTPVVFKQGRLSSRLEDETWRLPPSSNYGAPRESRRSSITLGEFFALPIFTCAGLMYLVSAIDFIFIFVAIELVTISFYVLVSFTRKNPITLEAGVKYLVLSALSTGFLVYGITWIFGATGETN